MVYSQTSFHHVRSGVSHLLYNYFCVNAAPCRWLAWGKESVKCEKLYHNHRTRPHQPAFPGSTTTQPLETYSRSEQTKPFRDHQDCPPTRGVGYLNRFQGHLLPYTYTETIQEIPEISHPRSGIPVQGPAIWFVHSTHRVHCDTKGGETDDHTQRLRIHQYLDDWLVRARSHQSCL